MSRTIQISLPSEKTDGLVRDLREAEGIVGITLQRGASIKPAGDVVSVETTNEGLHGTLKLLARHDIGEQGSIVTGEPRSLVSPLSQSQIDQETNEATWPEMAALLHRETNVSTNYLMAMLFAGVVAGAGLWTDTPHIVVGAMVIAPGFEPIIRVPFGLLAGNARAWKHGLVSTLVGYGAMVLGALVALSVLLFGSGSETALEERYWVQYWSSTKLSSIVVALAAGAAGAAIIAAQRSVLTAGVMIALALVPSACIVGMAVATGEFALAGSALMRWLSDATCVVLAGGLVFFAKRRRDA